MASTMTSPIKRAIWIVCLIAAVALSGLSVYALLPARTPPPQPALSKLDAGHFSAFEERFDASADRIRVVALLSPT